MDSRKIVTFIFLLFTAQGQAQISSSLRNAVNEAIGQRDLTRIGIQFLGKPYHANALSAGNPELLVADLESFDCVTFIEN